MGRFKATDFVFELIIEKGINLPKVGLLGQVNGFVVLNFTVKNDDKIEQKSCQTRAIMNNFNPLWNSRFMLHHLHNNMVRVELFAYDKTSSNHLLGSFPLDLSQITTPLNNKLFTFELESEYSTQRKDTQQSTGIYVSIGRIPSPNKIKLLANEFNIENLLYLENDMSILRSLESFGFDDSYLVLQYNENFTVNISIISKVVENDLLVFIFNDDVNKTYHGVIKKENKTFDVCGIPVQYQIEISNINLCNVLSRLSICRVHQNQIVSLSDLSLPRGWKGKMSFLQANLTLANTYFIEFDERILFEEEHFIVGIKDYSKTCEISLYMKESGKYFIGLTDSYPNHFIKYDIAKKFPDIKSSVVCKIASNVLFPFEHPDIRFILYEIEDNLSINCSTLIPFVA
ncbi:C2 domain-containing protein [Entamoeba marina]